MPTSYSKIISAICSTLSGGGTGVPSLVLLPSTDLLEPREDRRPREQAFEVPDAMIPDGAEPVYLPADERFLVEAEKLLLEQSPSVVFAIPPWIRDMDLSREWIEEHSRPGLIEAFVEQVFHPPAPPLNQQLELGASSVPHRTKTPDTIIMFVPYGFIERERMSEWRSRFFNQHATTIIEHDHHLNVFGFGWQFPGEFRAVTLVIQKESGSARRLKIGYDMLDADQDIIEGKLQSILTKATNHL
jgi:hypothetical protein